MSESETFLTQFEKLIQTLSSINTELQLDVIQKVELRLNQYKTSIQSKRIDCDFSEGLKSRNNLNTKSDKSFAKNSYEMNDRLDKNSDINSYPIQTNRKSERILNRKTKQNDLNEEKVIKISKTLIERSDEMKERTSGDNRKDDSSDAQKKESVEAKAYESSTTTWDEIVRQFDRKAEEVVVKRKWRRVKDINDLKCKYCGKIWRSLSHLEIHLRTHTGEKAFKCEQCDQQFSQLAGLQVHQRRHNNDRPFKCEVCNKAFYTKVDLSRHYSSHQKVKQITQCCDICGKGFSDKRKLKNHIRFVHQKKESVVCEICGHTTHGQHLLYAHKRTKHGQMPKYACPVCQALIGSRSAFVIHLRAHADIKPCVCDICGKRFRSTSQVARHKLAHMEGRHTCELCGKKFKTPHHLRRHSVVHSGVKPFSCHLCDYKCNVNSNIVKHVKGVHGIVDFSLVTQPKRVAKPTEVDALEKGSLVAQEVLKDIAITKGHKITVKELKRLDEKKVKEKELLNREISQTLSQRKRLIKRKVESKSKNNILDLAIKQLYDHNQPNLCTSSATANCIDIDVNRGQELPALLIPNSTNVYEITSNPNQTNKSNSSLAVGDEQHFKDIITLHFAN